MFLFGSRFSFNTTLDRLKSSGRRPPIVHNPPEVDDFSEACSRCYLLVNDRARSISISSLSDPILPRSTMRCQDFL